MTDWAVLPVENSLGGSIHTVYDLLLRYRLHIVGETSVAVNHCLLALPGTKIGDLKRVISHPQASQNLGGTDPVFIFVCAFFCLMEPEGEPPTGEAAVRGIHSVLVLCGSVVWFLGQVFISIPTYLCGMLPVTPVTTHTAAPSLSACPVGLGPDGHHPAAAECRS